LQPHSFIEEVSALSQSAPVAIDGGDILEETEKYLTPYR